MRPTKVLHPTDYTEIAQSALRAAAEIAHDYGATLVLLHAVDTLGPEHVSYGEASQPQPEGYRQRLWKELHQVRPPDSHIRVEYVLSEEDPVTAILRTADALRCDLIVLGTHGHTGWRRWLLGSTAEEVVRRANCPVLVVKPVGPASHLAPFEASDLHPGHLVQKEEAGAGEGS